MILIFFKSINKSKKTGRNDNKFKKIGPARGYSKDCRSHRNTFINESKSKQILFLGIGGIGMSAIAKYLFDRGNKVMGYDKTPSPITAKLIDSGISVLFDASVSALPEDYRHKETQIVYTPAVSIEHPQLNFFNEQGNDIKKRAEVLGEITKDSVVFAIAGPWKNNHSLF